MSQRNESPRELIAGWLFAMFFLSIRVPAAANPIAIGTLNATFSILSLCLLLLEVITLEMLLGNIRPGRKFLVSFFLLNLLTFPLSQSLFTTGVAYLSAGHEVAAFFISTEAIVILVESVAGYFLLKMVVTCQTEVTWGPVIKATFLANLLSVALGLGMVLGAKNLGINPFFSPS